MNQQVTSTPSNLKLFFTSKWFWMSVAILICGTGITYVAIDNKRNDPLKAAYQQLTIPSTWKLKEKSGVNGLGCFAYDVACPVDHYIFSTSNASNIASEVNRNVSKLKTAGYNVNESCLEKDCLHYFIKASNSETAVRISAQKDSSGSDVIYIDIEKN